MGSSRYNFGKNSIEGAYGRYPKGLEGQTPTDPRPAIQAMMDGYAQLLSLHRRVVGNDGRIIGTERSRLLDAIDSLALSVIMTLRKFSLADSVDLAYETDQAGPLVLDFDKDDWALRGRLFLGFCRFSGGFSEYYREKLSPPFRDFLEEYKTHALDNQISELEAAAIILRLRDILFYVIKLYALVYHLEINE